MGAVITGQAIQTATVKLTSAQVLAIGTTQVTIIASPGSGLMIQPLTLLCNYTFVTTAYTDGGGNLSVATNYGVGAFSWFAFATAGWWDQASSRTASGGITSTALKDTVAHLANQPLQVGHTVASPTLGDGTVTVTVAYMVVPVS